MLGLIAPHGGSLIDRVATGSRLAELKVEAAGLQRLTLSPRQSCDLEMIGIGAFSPLDGFMSAADFQSVCAGMKLARGDIWPIPILLSIKPGTPVPAIKQRIALHAPNGVLQAIMTITEVFARDKATETAAVFRTTDPAHPGVQQVLGEGDTCLAGPVDVVQTCTDPTGPEAFLEHRLTPAQTRAEFHKRGWKTICAFQTRNPIHRAHEYLCKVAQEICDGLLIHPLVGETKPGDIPAPVRMQCYRVLIDNYFVPARTMLSVLPAAMRYAGPREAVLHALVRKNYGCTHFIVGRDHAGIGNFYGTYDAQAIFDELDAANLAIVPLKFEHAAYSKRAQGMVTAKTFPRIENDQIALSGTVVRQMLSAGRRPPAEFTRPEVADVLITWAQGKK